MIYILTGDDIVSSRNKLTELTVQENNLVRIDGKKQTISDVEEAFDANSLFGDKKTIVIEYFTKVKPAEKIIELASKFVGDENVKIILWDEADAGVRFANIKGTTKISFAFPKVYFAFLDSLLPSSKDSLTLFHDLIRSTSVELLLYSMIKRIRQLLFIKTNVYLESTEFKNMQSWQIGKLKKQSEEWTEAELKQEFLNLAALDEKLKTSALTMALSKHLDIIMLSDLN